MRFSRKTFVFALFGAVFSLVGAFAAPGYAETVKPAVLDAAAKADIVRIEAYLNGIKTMRTRFLQIAQTGETASGVMTLSRPGKFRFEYDPPSPIMLVATGTFLIYIDRALEQTTYVLLRNTALGVLVADNVKLSGSVTVTRFERGPGVLRVTLVRTEEPADGSITLVFADSPMTLRQWHVIDGQGAQTTITLDTPEYGVAVTNDLFHYEKPGDGLNR